ncbi:helix-turn-helix domain-containing protein [Massilia sp. R2A-15]|uniref:Crp/Fnr family transcriptional regulator n=1 Tax=Massilia sp. R2A-15 TaxID=3064278 RepID=UPI002733778A|nr:helix-turn-helix domain-containing protein [Massilia sp. R2A-15]WLI88225.1 helix-turn-helix domain-containing protein [Massilia sp. R2A-15]
MNAIPRDRQEAAGVPGCGAAADNRCALCGGREACLPSLFHSDDNAAFERMVAGKRRIERHASLFRANDKFDTFYIVRVGQFKEFVLDPASVQRVVRFYMPGDIVGFDGVATGVHSSRVMALEDSEVCEVPYAQVRKAMHDHPRFLDRFLAAMSATLLDQHQHTRLLTLPSLDGRFACFLLYLSANYARMGYSDTAFRLAMSRSDIGSYLGTTVETVSRLIARFNAQHAVRIERRMVQILDRAKLIAMIDNTAADRCPVPAPTEDRQPEMPVH